jgi:hypothetical protein
MIRYNLRYQQPTLIRLSSKVGYASWFAGERRNVVGGLLRVALQASSVKYR